MYYGIMRNGEHLQIFPSRNEAEQFVKREKAKDSQLAADGWIKDASKVSYRVVEQKRRRPW